MNLSCANHDDQRGERGKSLKSDTLILKEDRIQREQDQIEDIGTLKKVDFKNIIGSWKLLYRGNYGYEFRFYSNYKAVVILYLHDRVIIFKGVYTIEEKSNIRINILEMKSTEGVARVNLFFGFVKTKSSYFIFKGGLKDGKGNKVLIVRPEKIIIDSNNSDGYFEPVLHLKKII